MKTLSFILLMGTGIFLLTKEDSKPEVIEIQEIPAKQTCISPNSKSGETHEHQGCCISSGRASYILGNIDKE
ncbi:hypothetical protein [Aestuariibaculum sediminum]|uniref:Uncharacterized protein n=1 Tax=Aestuariibaculum sediminum TaxID=2770637 RepID=A0A8J6PY68_9FLAO|nr:hypothetical protein [Aestuariibaculum sediminum]MBD0830738.1 hypothetical protein [Aestuariibaculum sediminum]